MRVFIACPAPPGSRKGNRVTAVRWARILRSLGHFVEIGQDYRSGHWDLLVALHARKSAPAVQSFRRLCPHGRIVLALTGTDLYRDIHQSASARMSLEAADRLVTLHSLADQGLPLPLRRKVRVIYQSCLPTPIRPRKLSQTFDVAVLGHLRPVKDPFRSALALRGLSPKSRIRVVHAGSALSPSMAGKARKLMASDPRYRWIGEVPRWKARRLLARSKLLVLSSLMEGGANVISEAVVDGVPVLASRIAGSVGLLGEGYPGYFPAKGTRALEELLRRAENDPGFYSTLKHWCRRLAPLFRPDGEKRAWTVLLNELFP